MIYGCYFEIQSVKFQSHSAVVDVYCSRLLGMLGQNTNFGSDCIARVNPSGV